MKKENNEKFYIIGGGIASLASAAYLIRDGKILGENIIIFEETSNLGGSLDGEKFSENAYILRGYRMFENKVYSGMFDLMSFIPSLDNPEKTLKDEFLEFNEKNDFFNKCRLVEKSKRIDSNYLGLSWKDKYNLLKIITRSEKSLGFSQIKDNFTPEFFKTNFWYETCTVFAFQSWHSAAEFRRYCLRYIHTVPYMSTVKVLKSTPYAQSDSITLPIVKWLKERGVIIRENSRVYDFDFGPNKNVERIYYFDKLAKKEIIVNENDYVLATIGSMTENSSFGSMDEAPTKKIEKIGGAWELWKNIANKVYDFGNPSAFTDNIEDSEFQSFTITFQDSTIPNLIENFTGRAAGRGEGLTFKDSNWLMSLIVPYQPHFINQPKNLTVCWGFGLFSREKGNFVKKRMLECSGKEILIELFSHFGFDKKWEMEKLIEKSICIPCRLPYATSQFLPRKKGDRPKVIPKGSKNFAFLGQFCEIPKETTFTIEYSIKSAQKAVYSLLHLGRKTSPIYRGERNIKVLFNALKIIFKNKTYDV